LKPDFIGQQGKERVNMTLSAQRPNLEKHLNSEEGNEREKSERQKKKRKEASRQTFTRA